MILLFFIILFYFLFACFFKKLNTQKKKQKNICENTDVPQTVANYRAWTALPGVCTNDDFRDGKFKSFKWECCDEGRVRAKIYDKNDCSGDGKSLDDAVPPNGNNVGCTFCEGPPCPKVPKKKIR